MSVKVKVDFLPNEIIKDMGIPKMRLFLANEIIRISDPYVPFRDGYLKNSAMVENGGRAISYGSIGPSKAYASRWWYEQANFNEAPIRGNQWTIRAVADNDKQLSNIMQRYADRSIR